MPTVRPYRRSLLSRALLIATSAVSLPALAADECGPASPGGQVVCTPTPAPMPQVRYEGVTDFEVVLKSGVSVDGTLLPERDTAVVIHGDGALSLMAEDGSVIRNDTWPAVDIASTSGSVNVRVDAVYGGFAGIAAVAGGDVSVWANHVEGDFAIVANSLGGNVIVDVASVHSGPGGAGVWADTTAGDVLILAGEAFSEGDFGKGLYASSENGSVAIEAGYIRAEGVGALGVLAESWENGDVVVDADTVAAVGDGSVGIIAAAGAGDVAIKANWVSSQGNAGRGIGAFAFNGAVLIDAEGVATDGDFARGIDVSAFGDVAVRNGSVFTTGINSDAVSIETVGDVAVESQRLATYGNESYGLRVLTSGNVSIDVEEITTFGERSAGLYVASGNGDVAARVGRVHTLATTGDWFAVGLSAWAGDAMLLIDKEVRADSGYAVTTASLTGGARIGVAEGAQVYGQAIAIDSTTATGTRIDIAGLVESGAGPVIKVSGNDYGDGAADIRIGTTGRLRGRVDLSVGDDAVVNGGTFETSGVSIFGEGEDRFTNAGAVVLEGEATGLRLAGLESFDNAGRVSLLNGRTGDVFAVEGAMRGLPGGVLAIDVDVADRTADRIEVGSLAGTNALELDLGGKGSLLGLSGIQVLTSGSAQNGSELVLADKSRNVGLIGFKLKYDGLASWTLESDLADEAYLAAAVPGGVRDLWRQGTQSVFTHLAATDALTEIDGVWFQMQGGDFEGTSHLSHARGSRELQWEGTHNGVQLGAETTFGQWRVGVTGGYGRATMDLGAEGRTTLDSINAGAYARYSNAGWFTGAVLRGERVEVDADWQAIGLADQGDGSAVGIELEAGHRFTTSHAWIEPLVRVSWIDVQLPEQHAQAGDIRWGNSALSTGELGLRAGTERWGDLRPYASVSLAREFGNGDATVYEIGAESVRVSDEGGRTFGRFAGGAEWSLGRVDLYAEIEARVGDMEGVGGRLGARIRF